jgi:hypothetical protein
VDDPRDGRLLALEAVRLRQVRAAVLVGEARQNGHAVLAEQLDRRAGDGCAGRDGHDEHVVRAVGGVLHEEAEIGDEHDAA